MKSQHRELHFNLGILVKTQRSLVLYEDNLGLDGIAKTGLYFLSECMSLKKVTVVEKRGENTHPQKAETLQRTARLDSKRPWASPLNTYKASPLFES